MKKIAALLIVLGLLVAAVPVVFADGDDPTTGDITITGSAATIQTFPIVMEQVVLDGEDQTAYLDDPLDPTVDNVNQSWRVTDPRGNGAGWTATIIATDFEGVDGTLADTKNAKIPLVGTDAHTGQNLFRMRLVDNVDNGGIDWIDGQCTIIDPIVDDCDESDAELIPDTVAPFTAYRFLTSGPAQTFVGAAADEGMGSYYLEPEFELVVPAETYSGVYRSTLTVTLNAPLP